MTTLIKTQCPSCQAYFSLPQTLLNELDAKVRCKRCQQIFLVNEHLVVSGDEPSDISSTSTSNEKTQNNTAQHNDDDFLSSDTLIHDDMPIDDLEPSDLEYDSWDEMSAWSFDLDTTQMSSVRPDSKNAEPKPTDATTSGSPNPHNIYDEQEKAFEESNYVINTKPQYNNASAASTASSRNDNTSNDSDNDNAWLEKLLEEQNSSTDVIESGTNLSQLLTSMGVPLRDQVQNIPKQANKAQSHIYPVQTRMQTSIASLLWLAGCLVLIMLLFAQYVIFNLDNLVKNPMYAERLQAVCAVAACSLPNADMTAFDIINVVYRPSEVKTANGFTDIAATLANQSVKSQLLPNLKVSIYGNDDVIGEFIAMPKDYLVSKQNLLSAAQNKSFMFTVPVVNNEINKITIDPIY